MVISVGVFSLMDALLKLLSEVYPPFQVTTIRAFCGMPLILLWIASRRAFGTLFRIRLWLHVVRAILGVGMMGAFVYALTAMPLSAIYSIFFVAPLMITAFAVPILGERVGWRRWVAIAIGLLTVLVLLSPGAGDFALLPGLAVLGAAIGYAITAITMRILSRTDSVESMIFWYLMMMGTGSLVLALPDWIPLRWDDALVIAGVAVTGSVAQWAITEAFSRGESSFLAPFEYTAIVWGVVLDLTVWGTLPPWSTFAGAAVIIVSGLYLIHREQVADSLGSVAQA